MYILWFLLIRFPFPLYYDVVIRLYKKNVQSFHMHKQTKLPLAVPKPSA
jgi:hypothetical protein